MRIDDARVVLHLRVSVSPKKRSGFLAFCREAFPIYESVGGCRMALYEEKLGSGRFDEVGYYDSRASYRRGESAIRHDPAQKALIERWQSLLSGPPKVSVYFKTGNSRTSSMRRRTRQFSKSIA